MLVELEIAGESDKAIDKIDPVVAQIKEVQSANPDFYVGSVGVSTRRTSRKPSSKIWPRRAHLDSDHPDHPDRRVRSARRSGIPLLLGITAILATMGLISIWSQWLPMEEAVGAMVLLIGLAVGVDYSMFYLKREREERAKGRSEEAALEAAAATSGRSVLISGLTVLVAMSGMFLTGDATFASFGIATMTVVAIAMLGSLTVLPAVLSKLGDKVDRGRVPFVHRLSRKDGEGRIWGAIINRVLKRPVISVVLSAGLLIALAIPAFQLRTAQPSFDTFPQNLLTTYNRLKEAFPGTEISANVVVKAPNVEAPEVQEAIGQLQWRAIDSGVMNDPIDVDVNAAKTVATVAIPIEGDGTDATSKLALTTLRDEIVPVTVGTLAGAEVGVTGLTAQSEDFNAQMKTAAPLVFGFVLIFAFLLMLVSFRSIVIATKAVPEPALGRSRLRDPRPRLPARLRKQLLGFEVTGGIDPFLPLLLFVILFGPLDGLPRLHPQPDPRGLRLRHADRSGDLARDQVDRRRGHERRYRHGRGVLRLRSAPGDDLQAVRRRARLGDPDRRRRSSGRSSCPPR